MLRNRKPLTLVARPGGIGFQQLQLITYMGKNKQTVP